MFQKSFICLVGGTALSCALALKGHPQATNFTDVSLSSGVQGLRSSYGNPVWLDLNNDGGLDIFLSHHGQTPSLFLNNMDGTFVDMIPTSGISERKDRHGVGVGDFDNDGDLDIFITIGACRGQCGGEKRDELYRNEGNGKFIDITEISGVSNIFGQGRSVNWMDYDNDGYIDLFIKNVKHSKLYRNNGDGTFIDVTQSSRISSAKGTISGITDYDNDGHMDIFIVNEGRDQIWKNNGNGTFSEVAFHAGIKDSTHGKGIALADYNHDGYPDLYIARGYPDMSDSLSWSSSAIYFSDVESGKDDGFDFQTVGTQLTFDLYFDNCRTPLSVFIGGEKRSPMAIPFTITELDARGEPSYLPGQDVGFFIWKDDSGWHSRWSSPGAATQFFGKVTADGEISSVHPIHFTEQKPVVISTLYKNNGDGTFTDVSAQAGVASTTNNRGAIWGDYDNDGHLDLYVLSAGSPFRNGPNALYRNNGDGTFTDVAKQAGVLGVFEGRGDGAAWGDLNNDGFLDLFVTNGWIATVFPQDGGRCLTHGPQLLYQNNRNSNKWLQIRLRGTLSNRDGIGTKVSLHAGGQSQFRESNGGGGGQFFSQGGGPLSFGVGAATRIERLELVWPNGGYQEVKNLGVNQLITLVEGQSIAQGQPVFQGLGYYLWQTTTGKWHLRWYGQAGQPRHQFTGRVTTDGTFTQVTTKSFEDNDALTWDATTLVYTAFTRQNFDEVAFTTTGTWVTFALQRDGAADPSEVRIGTYGLQPGSLPLTLPN